MKTFRCFMLAVMAITVLPSVSAADRLYTWTDDKGVSHITKNPPPTGAKQKDVIDYSHRTHEEQQVPVADRQMVNDLQRQSEQALSQEKGKVEQYRKDIRRDLKKEAAKGNYSCHFQAPDRRVYVRVYSTNRYDERDQAVWMGWIEPYQQALVISPTKTVLYIRKWEAKGPFGGYNRRSCSGGGVIQIPSG